MVVRQMKVCDLQNGAKSGFEMCFDIGSRHIGCWGQNTSPYAQGCDLSWTVSHIINHDRSQPWAYGIQNKEVYATLCLHTFISLTTILNMRPTGAGPLQGVHGDRAWARQETLPAPCRRPCRQCGRGGRIHLVCRPGHPHGSFHANAVPVHADGQGADGMGQSISNHLTWVVRPMFCMG